jgi:hypothetical protein
MSVYVSLPFVLRFAAMACGIVGSAGPALAVSPDEFQGAWAVDMDSCSSVFTTKDGRMTFAKNQGDSLPGFIVDGKRIRGLSASCSVVSTREKGDTTTLLLSCQSQIMFGDMTVSVKMKDPDTLDRVDPDFPQIETTYHRCK